MSGCLNSGKSRFTERSTIDVQNDPSRATVGMRLEAQHVLHAKGSHSDILDRRSRPAESHGASHGIVLKVQQVARQTSVVARKLFHLIRLCVRLALLRKQTVLVVQR